MTHVFTGSGGIESRCYGWNAEKKYHPQRRMAVVSAGECPALLEVAGGNLHEIHMLSELEERLFGQTKNSLILVSDRRCTCKKVVESLLEQGQPFLLPLKKNRVKEEVYKGSSVTFFTFHKRRIGWREEGYKVGKGEVRLLVFEDPILEGYQKNLYRAQYAKEGEDIEELRKKEERAGKIALITNTSLSSEKVFELYKMYQYVEEIVDRYRNHLLEGAPICETMSDCKDDYGLPSMHFKSVGFYWIG